MTKFPSILLALALVPGFAHAQMDPNGPPPPADENQPAQQSVQPAQPNAAQPNVQPPSPPAAPPPRAQSQVQQPSDDDDGPLITVHSQADEANGLSAQQQAAPPPPAGTPAQTTRSGQWVYTSQYGWVWMPYGNQYVDEGVYGDANPYAYVYSVGWGWSWVAAPWLWGWGPYPFFGVYGPAYFGWYRGLYAHGWGWGGYRPFVRGGTVWRGGPVVRGGGRLVGHPGGFVSRGGVSRGFVGTRGMTRMGAGGFHSVSHGAVHGGGHVSGGFHGGFHGGHR
jgi:hypothetical protein